MPFSNNEKRNTYQREYRKRNPDYYQRCLALSAKWRDSHIDRVRFLNRESKRKRYKKYRRLALERLGMKCENCEITDERLLEISHKNGDGKKDLETFGDRGHLFYRSISTGIRTIEDLELLCANCHILYEYEKGFRK